MPQSLRPLNRRQFVRVVAASAGWIAVRPALAADADPHRLALLSDTHIGESPTLVDLGCNMAERLRAAVGEVTALTPRPAGVVIAGDLAWKTGVPGDYALLAQGLEPLRRSGIPLHLALGNHDNRGNFITGMAKDLPRERPVDGRQVLIVETPRLDVLILDTLEPRLDAAGQCGAAQLGWLAKALDRTTKKPAMVVIHHNPQWKPDPSSYALRDTQELWGVLRARPRVQALVFGHTHQWTLDRRDGIHLINLPAVAYPFRAADPTGWVDAWVGERGIRLTLQAFRGRHADHGKAHELAWR